MEPKRLSKSEILTMADIMSDAFLEHQNLALRIRKTQKRKKIMNTLFIVLFSIINKYGFIFEVTRDNKPIAYITYMDPKDKEQISFRRILKVRGLRYGIKLLFLLNPRIIKSMRDYMKLYHSHTIHNENTIHLYSTGIKKEYRGKGIMGIELRNSFEYFFSKGYKHISLETSDERNLVVYQKLGFEMVEILTKKNQSLFFMDYKKVI